MDPVDRQVLDDGLVLILKELHDKLDAAVISAYDWPADLTDDDILARIVALNSERAKEEARGFVRWVRPDYQIPLLGSPKEKTELDLVGGTMSMEASGASGPKPLYPTDDIAQTAAVMAPLADTTAPLDAAALSATFRQGRRIAPKVQAVLAALARMGFVTTIDSGRSFQLRRAA